MLDVGKSSRQRRRPANLQHPKSNIPQPGMPGSYTRRRACPAPTRDAPSANEWRRTRAHCRPAILQALYTAVVSYSRRDLSLLLPALAAANAAAQKAALPSKAYAFADLPVRVSGPNKSRAILNGATRSAFPIELHMTELPPGGAPHPPHHHVHEEMVMIHEGTLEVTISGRSANLGPGSVAYVASGEEHGWRNVGTTRALYFVLALGRETA